MEALNCAKDERLRSCGTPPAQTRAEGLLGRLPHAHDAHIVLLQGGCDSNIGPVPAAGSHRPAADAGGGARAALLERHCGTCTIARCVSCVCVALDSKGQADSDALGALHRL